METGRSITDKINGLGNGKRGRYWLENWTGCGPLIEILEDGPLRLGVPLDATIEQGCTTTGWRLPSTRNANCNLSSLRRILTATPPPTNNSDDLDMYFWNPQATIPTDFSASVTWENIRQINTLQPWTVAVWFKGHVPKHAFNFWVATQNRLPTRSRLSQWGVPISPLCCLCNLAEETREHLFLHCSFSLQVWTLMLRRLGQPLLYFLNWDVLITWMLSRSPGVSQTLKRLVTQTTVYHLWQERNYRLHRAESRTDASLYAIMDRNVKDILLGKKDRKMFSALLDIWFKYPA